MAKKKTGRKIAIFSLIALAVGGLGVWAWFKQREPPVIVQTERVSRRNVTETVVANGRIQPVIQVKISPEVSGEIIALPVKEGQQVKKGDLLLKIKPDFYVANRNSSEASYLASLAGKATAAANLQKAEAEFKRHQELFDQRLISESVFLEVKTAYDIAKAQLESATHQVDMAKAALDRATEDLRKTEIYSPIDGTVSKLNSQVGERVVGTAMMAGTEIMTIADLDVMEARVDVNEIDVVLIALGQKARLEVDAFRDQPFTGTVTEIANSSRGAGLGGMGGGQAQEGAKFEVRIRLNEKAAFRPGMSVTAEIETRYRTNVLTVPIAAVTTRLPKERPPASNPGHAKSTPADANHAALCATNSTAGGTNSPASVERKKPNEPPKPIEVVFLRDGERAKMVPIRRGISDDAFVEITAGLEEGQEVIAGGYKAVSKDLDDGKKIRIGPAKSDRDKEKK